MIGRRLLVTGSAVLILCGSTAGLVLVWGSAARQPAASAALPPATAEVTRTTLVATRTVAGTLGFGDPAPLTGTGTGTLTWIALVGSTVERGEPLFKIDERPVVAFYGSVPMYRTLRVTAGTEMKGADVQQFQENLIALGYPGLIVDRTYTAAAAKAVRAWQADLGLEATGIVEPGEVVFIPEAVRIAEHKSRVGDLLGERGVPVLSYTGTSRLVSVELKVTDQALAIEGREVTVRVPGRDAVEGTISKVGSVVTAESEPSQTAQSAASEARMEVTVTLTDQNALGSLDAAPVDVDFVSDERKDVLTVPVAALLALTQGGVGLEIVDGQTTRIVAVKTGMFAAGRVEVSGDGIAEGVIVGVPT